MQEREAKKKAVEKGWRGAVDLVWFGNRGVKVTGSNIDGGEQKED